MQTAYAELTAYRLTYRHASVLPLRISDLRNKPLRRPNIAGRQCVLWHARDTSLRPCVPTYARNTYPGVGSVLRAIIACRPEDSLRPVLSYPSSSLATVPRQTHDHNPSFPFLRSVSLPLSTLSFHYQSPFSHPYRLSVFLRRNHLSEAHLGSQRASFSSSPVKTLALRLTTEEKKRKEKGKNKGGEETRRWRRKRLVSSQGHQRFVGGRLPAFERLW